MENPYQSPDSVTNEIRDEMKELPNSSPPGMVSHVPVIAILMVVHGLLCTVFGVGLMGMAVIVPTILTSNGDVDMGDSTQRMGMYVAMAGYAGMGLAGFLPGVLQIYAGMKNVRYRKRMLGLIALSAGALTTLTCYCGPTGIALMIYGIIVYINDPVKIAFVMGEHGRDRHEIMTYFYSGNTSGGKQ